MHNGLRSRFKKHSLTKIKDANQFWLWIKYNILWLDVMMNNVETMQVLQSV